jgi:hypothetical protein
MGAARTEADVARKLTLKRANNARYRSRIKNHQTCVQIILSEEHFQAFVASGRLPEERAHLRDEIARAAQQIVDQFALQAFDM